MANNNALSGEVSGTCSGSPTETLRFPRSAPGRRKGPRRRPAPAAGLTGAISATGRDRPGSAGGQGPPPRVSMVTASAPAVTPAAPRGAAAAPARALRARRAAPPPGSCRVPQRRGANLSQASHGRFPRYRRTGAGRANSPPFLRGPCPPPALTGRPASRAPAAASASPLPQPAARKGGHSGLVQVPVLDKPGTWNQTSKEQQKASRPMFVALGRKYSSYPTAAQSLTGKGFNEQQHPKASEGERHSADDSTLPEAGKSCGGRRWPATVAAPGATHSNCHQGAARPLPCLYSPRKTTVRLVSVHFNSY